MQTIHRIKEVELYFSLKTDSNLFLVECCPHTMHYFIAVVTVVDELRCKG